MGINADSFTFTSYSFDPRRALATFHFELMHDGARFPFTETLQFPPHPPLSPHQSIALDRALFSLHLILGISYWKLFCPKEIRIKSGVLSCLASAFMQRLYTIGLGEFYYRNQIDFRTLVSFSPSAQAPDPMNLSQSEVPLVAFGGGKDSLVSIELLKSQGTTPQLYALHHQEPHEGVTALMKKTGCRAHHVLRVIDPQIMDSHLFPGHYQGHIPISIVYAFVGAALALMQGVGSIIVSNESSANAGNTTYLGHEINHQWSKSFEAEVLIASYIRQELAQTLSYFSLLRPYSELAIAAEFARHTQYHHSFSSCNTNFKHDAHAQKLTWCLSCAKCVFSGLLLAAFLPRAEVIKIMGGDFSTREQSILHLKGLLGIDMKPFDCVGTPEEVRGALVLMRRRGEYQDSLLMQMAESYLSRDTSAALPEKLIRARFPHAIPSQFSTLVLS